MNRLLLIAYYFPPDQAIGGARPYRFYKYLKQLGYDCQVLTAAPQKETLPDVHFVEDPLREKPRQGVGGQLERVSWKFFLRGHLALGWSASVVRTAQALLATRPATILSTSPPVGTHLAAWRLARLFGVRWIADFRDPIDSAGGEKAPFQRFVAPRLERRILRRADIVLANTDTMSEQWKRQHPGLEGKLHVLWNGFDPDDKIDSYPLPDRSRKVWSHVGELYAGRNLRPFFDAIDRLIRKGSLSPEDVLLKQVGDTEAACLPETARSEEAAAQGWFSIQQAVPAKEARKIALDSDGLVLIQPQTFVQVPGKLFEYLRLGRPILAYILRDSPIEKILSQADVPYVCAYPENTASEMEAAILRFRDRMGREPASPGLWFEERFAAPAQAQILDRLISGVGKQSQ
jgi:glycosyltransferase involved in cell wall biosynthesis